MYVKLGEGDSELSCGCVVLEHAGMFMGDDEVDLDGGIVRSQGSSHLPCHVVERHGSDAICGSREIRYCCFIGRCKFGSFDMTRVVKN